MSITLWNGHQTGLQWWLVRVEQLWQNLTVWCIFASEVGPQKVLSIHSAMMSQRNKHADFSCRCSEPHRGGAHCPAHIYSLRHQLCSRKFEHGTGRLNYDILFFLADANYLQSRIFLTHFLLKSLKKKCLVELEVGSFCFSDIYVTLLYWTDSFWWTVAFILKRKIRNEKVMY